MTIKIEIGDEVKDEVSQKIGIVTTTTEWLYGCPRVAIHHGIDRDGKPLDHLWLDEPQALLIKKAVQVRKSNAGVGGINLGDKIKCRITGLVGIAYGVSNYMYGCTRIALAPSSLDKNGKPIEMLWADAPQFEVIKEEEIKRERNTTGGPMDSIPSQNIVPQRKY